jgi:tetratricopeptide (TPR) repeat protein
MISAQKEPQAQKPPFIGGSRHSALQQLEAAYYRTVQEYRPSLVVVSGIAGSGKTRLVQEFFNRLAAGQQESRYWPIHFSTVTPGTSLLKSRNLVHPQDVDAEQTKRTFSWYAQTCRRSADDLSLQFQSAIESYQKLIELNAERRVQRFGALASAGVVMIALTLEFLDNYISLPVLLQWCARVAGLVSFGWSLREFGMRIRESRHSNQKLVRNTVSETERVLAESLHFISNEAERFKTPTIVVIDEWHASDVGTQEFVNQLLSVDGPCFVILVRWLTGGENSEQSAFADQIESKATAAIELYGLDDDDIVAILKFEKPDFSTTLRRAIAKHSAGNPLIALKLCSFPQVLALARDDASEAEVTKIINQLPFDHEGILKEQWRAVPLEVQQLLSIASIYGEVIPTHFVKKAFNSFFRSDPTRVLKLAREPYWWLQILQTDIDMFPDASLYRIAKEEARFVLGNERLSQLETDIATIEDSELPDGLQLFGIYGNLFAEQKMINRIAVGLKTQSLTDAELVWRSVFTLGGSRFRERRLDLCREQIEWLSNYVPLPVETDLRSALLTQFRYFEFKSISADDPVSGRDLGLKLLSEIGDDPLRADLLLRLGNLSVAIEDYESAESFYSQVSDEDPSDDIAEAADHNRLLVLSRIGRSREAARSLSKLQRRTLLKVRVLGIMRPLSRKLSAALDLDEVTIMTYGNNIGIWLGRSGEHVSAVEKLRRTLKRAERLQRTPENLEKVWRCQSVLGYWTFKSGDAQKAREHLAKITSDQYLQNHISPDHIEAVSACQTLAAVEAYLGDTSGATQRLQNLAEVRSPSGVRLSKDASLQERQDFLMANLFNPETLMREW